MNDMVERVRRAICPQPVPCGITCETCWVKARTAIEAMREPTEAVIAAGNALVLTAGTASGCYSDHNPSPEEAYRAMIDAALKTD